MQWAVVLLVAGGCAEAADGLERRPDGGLRGMDAAIADGGRADVEGLPNVDALLLKTWRLSRPSLQRGADEAPQPFGPERPAGYGGGEGALRYLGRLGAGVLVAFERLDGRLGLFWLAIGGDAPEALATLVRPMRVPALVRPAPDGRAVAFFDAGRVRVARVGQPAEDWGAWGASPPDALEWTADSRTVVAADRTDLRAFSAGGPPRVLPEGVLLGAAAGGVFVRVQDRAVYVDLAGRAPPFAVTPATEAVERLVGVIADRAVFAFENPGAGRFADRIGAVPLDGGPVTWLSAPDAEARDATLIGEDVVYFEGQRGGGWSLKRAAVAGSSPVVTVSAPLGPSSSATLLGYDDARLFACTPQLAVVSVPRSGRRAAWTALAPTFDDRCRWWGQTDDHVVLLADQSPRYWRVAKSGDRPPAPLGDEVVAAWPEGVLSLPARRTSQLVRQASVGPARPLSEVYAGQLIASLADGRPEAGLTPAGDRLVARTAEGRWRAYDVAAPTSPQWLSPEGLGGRLVAIDPPWVVVHRDRAPVPDVRLLHLDGRYGAAGVEPPPRLVGAREVVLDRRGRRIAALVEGRAVVTPVEPGAEVAVLGGAYGILAHPDRPALFIVEPGGVMVLDADGLRRWAEAPNLSGQLALTADGAHLLAVEVTNDTAVPHPRAAWSIPARSDRGGPVRAARLAGIVGPLDFGFHPRLRRVPPGDRVLTQAPDGIRLEPVDASDPGVLILPVAEGERAPAFEPFYGPGGDWFAVATADRVVTYVPGGPAGTRPLPGSPVEQATVAGAYGVLIVPDAYPRRRLLAFRPAGEGFIELAQLPSTRVVRGVFGALPVVARPDGAGVVFGSDVGGDRSLYEVGFDGRGARALTAVDDAEEAWIGFVPRAPP